MTIAIVQVGTAAVFGGASLTATCTLTGVTPGNTILAFVNHIDEGSAGGTMSVTDGTSYTQDEGFLLGSTVFSGIFRLSSVGSGTHAVAGTCSAGTSANSQGSVQAIEVSGLIASPLDQFTVGHSLSSTTPATGSTGPLALANELLVTTLCINGSATGATWPPTGGPGVYLSAYNGLAINETGNAYQINAAGTSAVSAAAGTLGAAAAWVMSLATYQGSTIIPPTSYSLTSSMEF